ncbi:MAG: M20/M25/M40 family metallo-hydrolase [Saprospiraceae bacterium]|nr:M20/M25/M40 family metallo-hydrolase [Saprospiraceae bacterium]
MSRFTLLTYLLLLFTYTNTKGQSELLSAIANLKEFVAVPNNGLNKADIDRNIEWLSSELEKRGLKTQILPTDGNPLLFAEKIYDADLPTLLFYTHLDGQPVDPRKWQQENPYAAVLKQQDEEGNWETISWDQLTEPVNPEWRIFGRSAADDKAPIIAFLFALDRLHREGKSGAHNIKMIVDGEEEMGSPSLSDAVDQYKHLLKADAMIINDGPTHISGDPTLIFGCRGIMTLDMTVYGPVVPQHSGHYGNYAPNPIFRLSHLLSSMKNEDGQVTIDGFYDGINITSEEQEIMSAVPDNPKQINELLQIAEPEKVGKNYQEALQYTSFNARGILSGWVGSQARTIVPDYATVAIDIRLVPENDPARLLDLIKRHIEKQGYFIVDQEPTREERLSHSKIVFVHSSRSTLAFRTPMQSPVGNWLSAALAEKFGQEPIKIRMMGGTVPITDFVTKLNVPAVIVPMVNADNNQHSPNENMRIGHLQKAIDIYETLLTTPLSLKDGQ